MQLVRVATEVGEIHLTAGVLAGRRPLVAVLPGYDQVIADIAPLTTRFADFDLVLGLLPGHGGAPIISRPTVEACARGFAQALARALPGRRFWLVGNSLGGVIGMAIAGDPPPGMAGLVAIEPFLDGQCWPLQRVLAVKPTRFSTTVFQGSYAHLVGRMRTPCTVLAGDRPLTSEPQPDLPSLLSASDRALIVRHARLVDIPGGHDIAAARPDLCAQAVRGALAA